MASIGVRGFGWMAPVVALVVALGAIVAPVPGWAQGSEPPRFVSVIDDLPLMGGYEEVGQGMEFSTPQGRLVEATAIVRPGAEVTRTQTLDFYAATLPQLGWRRVTETTFAREGEVLELLFGTSDNRLTVRFSLAPSE